MAALRSGLEDQKRYLGDYPLAQALRDSRARVDETRDFSVSALQKQPKKVPAYMAAQLSRNDKEPAHTMVTVRKHNTRSELLSSRRRGLKEYEEQLFHDYERENAEALQKLTLETKLAGPQIFSTINSDIVVQDKTWTDRTVEQRGPEEIRTLRNIQALNKMKLRQENGMLKYPVQDLDFEKFQRENDPEMKE